MCIISLLQHTCTYPGRKIQTRYMYTGRLEREERRRGIERSNSVIGTSSLTTHSTLSPPGHSTTFSTSPDYYYLLLPLKVGVYSFSHLPGKDIGIDIYSLSPFPSFSIPFPFLFPSPFQKNSCTVPSQPHGKGFIPPSSKALSSDFGGQTTHEKTPRPAGLYRVSAQTDQRMIVDVLPPT